VALIADAAMRTASSRVRQLAVAKAGCDLASHRLFIEWVFERRAVFSWIHVNLRSKIETFNFNTY